MYDSYKAYIVDVDGTLYFQPPLRRDMAIWLMKFLLRHPLRWKEIYAIYLYRKIREKDLFVGDADFTHKEYEYVGERIGKSAEAVCEIINFWMIKTPLELIKKHKDDRLIDFLNKRKAEGAKIIIYSDYPVEDKLKALELKPDYAFYSEDEIISCMKPDTKGVNNIISLLNRDTGIEKSDILFIGDRMEKDGLCAKNAGIEYLILDRKSGNRYK